MWFQYLGLWHDSDRDLAGSWMFSAALYLITTAYLLRDVFQPRIMTQDKLFGAAAAYLMIGVFWAYLYAIIGFFYPQSFMIVGQPGRRPAKITWRALGNRTYQNVCQADAPIDRVR